MNGRPWTTGERKTLIEMSKRGCSVNEIAEIVNRAPSTVSRQKRKLGLPASINRPWTTAEEGKLREMVAAGKSKKEIGAALGRTPGACGEKRRALKIPMPLNNWTQEDDDKLASLADAEVDKREIAKIMGRTLYAIQHRCYILGIKQPQKERIKKRKKTKSTERQTEPKGSLCWRCNKACIRGCRWADRFEPVSGWDTTPNGRSYQVNACPEFEPDGKWRAK